MLPANTSFERRKNRAVGAGLNAALELRPRKRDPAGLYFFRKKPLRFRSGF
jgi:hypothetical protein